MNSVRRCSFTVGCSQGADPCVSIIFDPPQTLQRVLELILQPAGSRELIRARLLCAVRIASSVVEKREDMGRKMVVQALVRILSELACHATCETSAPLRCPSLLLLTLRSQRNVAILDSQI